MKSFFRIVNEILRKSLIPVTISAFLGMFLLVLGQVISRYIFGISYHWTFEVAVLLMLIVAFLGGSLALLEKEDGHVAIRFFVNKLPDRAINFTQLTVNLVMIAVSFVIGCGALFSLPRTWNLVHASIPWFSTGWFYLVIGIAMCINILYLLLWTGDIVGKIFKKKENSGEVN